MGQHAPRCGCWTRRARAAGGPLALQGHLVGCQAGPGPLSVPAAGSALTVTWASAWWLPGQLPLAAGSAFR